MQADASSSSSVLRAQLESELKGKRQCAYDGFECSQLAIDSYAYCLRHILRDKNAPYVQCSFVYQTNGKRCNLAAPRGERKEYGYCGEHAIKTTLTLHRKNSKVPPPHTAEVLLHSLAHYVRPKKGRTDCQDERDPVCTRSLDPFADIDAAAQEAPTSDALDVCSESESDPDGGTNLGAVWQDYQADSSDNESIDSEQEDPLKHANVYTAEEVSLLTREKLVRLQSLYIEQYRLLQHNLKERRRKYLYALRREKETCCNIYSQVRDNPKEQRLYKKLKAYNRYQRASGPEAILNKRVHDTRSKLTEGVLQKSSSFVKCMFTEGGVKCGEKTLPLAKHCRKHILEDATQVLFKACACVKADIECTTPVEAIFEPASCRLHAAVPELRSYSQVRKDSDSDLDEEAGEAGPEGMELPSGFLDEAIVKMEDSQSSLETLDAESLDVVNGDDE